MQTYTKMMYIIHTHGRLLHFLFWVVKFTRFRDSKTSANKRRFNNNICAEAPCAGRYCRGNYPPQLSPT